MSSDGVVLTSIPHPISEDALETVEVEIDGPDVRSEHAVLTTQASSEMVKAGADRMKAEREIFAKNGWGEPGDEWLAANAYEAMVFSVIGRALLGEGKA